MKCKKEFEKLHNLVNDMEQNWKIQFEKDKQSQCKAVVSTYLFSDSYVYELLDHNRQVSDMAHLVNAYANNIDHLSIDAQQAAVTSLQQLVCFVAM